MSFSFESNFSTEFGVKITFGQANEKSILLFPHLAFFHLDNQKLFFSNMHKHCRYVLNKFSNFHMFILHILLGSNVKNRSSDTLNVGLEFCSHSLYAAKSIDVWTKVGAA